MKRLIIAFSFALLFTGTVSGFEATSGATGENLAVDTLKRKILKTWNSKVFWDKDVSLEAFEKEVVRCRVQAAELVRLQPLNAVENKFFADFSELYRRRVFLQNLNDRSAVPPAFYKLLDVLSIGDPLFEKIYPNEGSNFLTAYIAFSFYREGKNEPDFFEQSKYALNHLKSEKLKTNFVGLNLFTRLRNHMVDSATMDLIGELNKLSNDAAFKKQVNDQVAFYSTITAGQQAPDFQLPNREGKMIKLSDFKGKAVVIDIWATWCGGCVANLPYFEAIAEEFKDRDDVVFMNIAWENEGMKPTWLKFLNDKKMKGIQLLAERNNDKQGADKEDGLKDKFRIHGIPRYVFIDKQGKFVESFGSYPSKPGFRELVLKTINN